MVPSTPGMAGVQPQESPGMAGVQPQAEGQQVVGAGGAQVQPQYDPEKGLLQQMADQSQTAFGGLNALQRMQLFKSIAQTDPTLQHAVKMESMVSKDPRSVQEVAGNMAMLYSSLASRNAFNNMYERFIGPSLMSGNVGDMGGSSGYSRSKAYGGNSRSYYKKNWKKWGKRGYGGGSGGSGATKPGTQLGPKEPQVSAQPAGPQYFRGEDGKYYVKDDTQAMDTPKVSEQANESFDDIVAGEVANQMQRALPDMPGG